VIELRVTVGLAGGLVGYEDAVAEGVEAGLGELCAETAVPGNVSVTMVPYADPTFRGILEINGSRFPLGDHELAWALGASRGQWPPPNPWEPPVVLAELDAEGVAEVMRHVTRELASRRPEALLGHDQAGQLADEWGAGNADRLHELSRGLLATRRSLVDRAALVAASGCADPDAAVIERMIDEAGGSAIEICIEPTLMRDLTLSHDDKFGRGQLPALLATTLINYGLWLPPINLRASESLPRGFVSFRLGELTSVPYRAPFSDEVVVVSGYLQPDAAIISTRAPGTDAPMSVIAAGRAHDVPSTITYSGMEYIALGLMQEIRRHAGALIDVGATNTLLTRLGYRRPRLREALEARIPMPRLTQLLRSLASSRLSISDLGEISQTVVEAPDDPEPLVRSRLGSTATSRLTGEAGTLLAYLLDPAAEGWLADEASWGSLSSAGPMADALVEALAGQLSQLPPGAPAPSIVTSDAARSPAAQLFRASHPDVIVTSYGELPAWLAIRPLARLSPTTSASE
jgi:FHIPEP family